MNKDLLIPLENLKVIFHLSDSKRLEPLFAYLNLQLEVLSDNLYFRIFQKLLHRVLLVLLKDLEFLVFPFNVMEDTTDRAAQTKIILKLLDPIGDFFVADGQGISEKFKDRQFASLRQLFSLFDKDSKSLMAMYSEMRSNTVAKEDSDTRSVQMPMQQEYIITGVHIFSVLMCRAAVDSDVRHFIEQKRAALPLHELSDLFGDKLNIQKEQVFERTMCFHCFISGTLFITSSSICFDPLLGKDRLILPLSNLLSVRRPPDSRTMYRTLEILTKDSQKHLFTELQHPRKCVKIILERAKQLGNSIVKEPFSPKAPHHNIVRNIFLGGTPTTTDTNTFQQEDKLIRYSERLREELNLPRETLAKGNPSIPKKR